MFFTEKDGYKKSEVDQKIESLTNEVEYLKFSLEEKDKLNIKLKIKVKNLFIIIYPPLF